MGEILEIKSIELDYEAFISINSIRNGMAFGGCRFSKNVSRKEVEELASCMTLKLALHGLPVGGAKGGFKVDPKRDDIKLVLADFGKKSSALLGSKVVLGKDLGATDEMMDFLYESTGYSQMSPAIKAASGKSAISKMPNKLRDMTGYEKNMTGKGVAWATEAFFGNKIENKRIIIQGAGAVGFGSAIRLMDLGCQIIAISDKDHMAVSSRGFDRTSLSQLVEQGVLNTSISLPGIEFAKSEQLYSIDSDVLVLAAASNSVMDNHVSVVKADLVVEGSNFGLVDSARKILLQKNKITIPDVVASSSSAAMVAHQMASGNTIASEKLWKTIETAIKDTTRKLLEMSKVEKMDLRQIYNDILGPELVRTQLTRDSN